MPSAADGSSLRDAPALVTGASSGIGEAIALALAEGGHPVALDPRDGPAVASAIWNAKGDLPTEAFRGTMLRPRDIADIVLWLLSRPPRVRIDEALVRPRRLPGDPV